MIFNLDLVENVIGSTNKTKNLLCRNSNFYIHHIQLRLRVLHLQEFCAIKLFEFPNFDLGHHVTAHTSTSILLTS